MKELIKKDYYQLICMDMDGTLLDSSKNILPTTNEILKKATAQRMQFLIATGRPPTGVVSYQDKIAVDLKNCYAVCFNGAVSYLLNDLKHPLTVHTTPGTLVSEIYACSREFNLSMHGFSHQRGLVLAVHNEYTNREVIHANMPWQIIDFGSLSSDEGFYKCILSGSVTALDALRESIPEHISAQTSIVRSDPHFLEFIAGRQTKGSAIEELCALLKVPLEKVVAFGDAENDVTMLKKAGLGVAMANADTYAKEACDLVTDSCDNDGIAKVLSQLI